MMSLTSIETKYLINQGLLSENIRNPFMYYMVNKNDYSLKYSQKGYLTSIGVAFYIAPFVNAITRSGTLEEKQLVFESMLSFKAFKKLASTKRGHAAGDEESVVEQATRVVTNVKNRQGKAQDAGMELLERMIETNHLMEHKVLLFLLEPGQIDKNIAGLVANKIMAKYQRPVCVLSRCEVIEDADNTPPWEQVDENAIKKVVYQGSARGYEKGGIADFRAVCLATAAVNYAEGHGNAFGLSIDENKISQFISKTDLALENLSNEPVYKCDYIWQRFQINPNIIKELGHWDTLWGKDMDEPLICLKNIRITPDMVTIYRKRGNTLKITIDNISLVKFFATEQMCEKFQAQNPGWIQVNIVGRADINLWQGIEYPQILIEDYEVTDKAKELF